MRRHRGQAGFTHFSSIPFIRPAQREMLSIVQQQIEEALKEKGLGDGLSRNNPNLFHLTLSMLTLPHSKTQDQVKQLLFNKKEQFEKTLFKTSLTTSSLGYFTRERKEKDDKFVNVIYLDLKKDLELEKVKEGVNLLVRTLMDGGILASQELKPMNIQYDHQSGRFQLKQLHITLFRCKDLYENKDFLQVFQQIVNKFQNLSLQCDSFDISTRFQYDQTKFYTPLYRLPLSEAQH